MPLLDSLGFVVEPNLLPIGTDLWMVTIDGGHYDLTFIRDPGGAG
jgi:hypothetical protein